MKGKTTTGVLLISVAAIIAGTTLWRDFSAQNLGESGLAVVTEGATLGINENKLPSELYIPKLGINADIQHLGITGSGNMAAPDNFSDVSWYKYGTLPGEVGSAVMAGHNNGIYVRGVFKRLHELKVGDSVYVIKENGEKLHFNVVEVATYPYNDAPLEKIFNRKDSRRLNLITCAGNWIESENTSDKRIVVYTELVE